MRLSIEQRRSIQLAVTELFGKSARVKLFGSRLDDAAKGGDIDLLVEVDEPVEAPAEMTVKLSVKIMRACNGRKVDVVLMAPNLPVMTSFAQAMLEDLQTRGILTPAQDAAAE